MKFFVPNSIPSITSDNMETTDMTISADKLNIAAFYLRDKIYNDKILAVIREYISNAIDEHISHSIDKPVQTWLSKDEDGMIYFNVRDFAKGLFDHDVRHIFGSLLESTKGHSNELTGGFGIGSKAGHAYSSVFEVVSHFEGIASYYTFSLEKDDKYPVPIGKTRRTASCPTEETGIEVRIPVSLSDLYTFKVKCVNFVQNCSSNSLLVEFKDLDGCVTTPLPETTFDLGIPNVVFSMKEKHLNQNVSGYSRVHLIRMGAATYPLPNTVANEIKGLYGSIIIEVPVGYLTIPISRESVDLTESNLKKLKEISDAINKLFDDYLKSFKINDLNSSYPYYGPFSIDLYNASGKTLASRSLKYDKTRNNCFVLVKDNRSKSTWREKIATASSLDEKCNYIYIEYYPHKMDSSQAKSELEKLLVDDPKIKIIPTESFNKEVSKNLLTKNKNIDLNTNLIRNPRVYMGLTRVRGDYDEILKEITPKNGFKPLDQIKTKEDIADHLILNSNVLETPSELLFLNTGYILNVPSSRLYNKLLELGFFSWDDLRSKIDEAREIHTKSSEVFKKLRQYKEGFGFYNPSDYIVKTLPVEFSIIKNPYRILKRLTNIEEKIADIKLKNPTVGIIIDGIEYKNRTQYYNKAKLHRNELRKVLKIN